MSTPIRFAGRAPVRKHPIEEFGFAAGRRGKDGHRLGGGAILFRQYGQSPPGVDEGVDGQADRGIRQLAVEDVIADIVSEFFVAGARPPRRGGWPNYRP